MSEKVWSGRPPAECDICEAPLADSLEGFVDGATLEGPWANMCLGCHGTYGRGLGTGKGQRYAPETRDGCLVWVKKEG